MVFFLSSLSSFGRYTERKKEYVIFHFFANKLRYILRRLSFHRNNLIKVIFLHLIYFIIYFPFYIEYFLHFIFYI